MPYPKYGGCLSQADKQERSRQPDGDEKWRCQLFVAYATKSWHCLLMQRQGFPAARTSRTGTPALCRTSLIVLPKIRSPIRRWPCVVIAIKSHCSRTAVLRISDGGS